MNLARQLGFFGLLRVVGAWVWDGADNAPINAAAKAAAVGGAAAKKNYGLRRNHGSLTPGLEDLANHSLYHKRSDIEAAPVHLKHPELPPPSPELPEVLRRIRCCNAYASFYSLGIFHRETEIIHGIAYGKCEEREVAIRVGDPIQLQVDDQIQVTFLDSNMIDTNDLLLLVAYRSFKSPQRELQFRSHIYKHRISESDVPSASVVTMDFYDGGLFYKGVTAEISDDAQAKTHRSEVLSDMKRDAEMSVHPGKYTIFLKQEKLNIAREEFIAKPNGVYCVLRVGSSLTEDMDKSGVPDFPDKLVVYPHDNEEDLGKSVACKMHSSSALLLMMLTVAMPWSSKINCRGQ